MKAPALLVAAALVAAGCGAQSPSTPPGGASGAPSAHSGPSPTAPGASPDATAVAACPSVQNDEGAPPEPVAPPDDLGTLEVSGHVELSDESLFAVGSGDVVWATSPAGKLWRIDAATAKVTRTVDLPDLGLARPFVAFDAVWIAEMASGRLLRLDPADGSIISTVDLQPSDRPVALAATDAAIVVANQTTNTITLVDVETMTVTAEFDLSKDAPGSDRAPSSVVVDGATAWVVEHRADALARLSLSGGEVTRTCLGDPMAGQVAAAAGSLWVAGAGSVVSIVDPATGEVTARLGLPAVTAGDLVVDGDTIWVGAGSHVIAINAQAGGVEVAAETGELSDERQLPGGVAIALTPGSVWTTDPASFGLLRFEKAAP